MGFCKAFIYSDSYKVFGTGTKLIVSGKFFLVSKKICFILIIQNLEERECDMLF